MKPMVYGRDKVTGAEVHNWEVHSQLQLCVSRDLMDDSPASLAGQCSGLSTGVSWSHSLSPISRSTVKNTGAGRARHFVLHHIDILWSMLVLSGMLPTHHAFQWVGSARCQSHEENIEMGEFKETQS